VDVKRRFLLPAKWGEDGVTEYCFVTNSIVQNNKILLYTAEKWKNILEAKQRDDAKKDFTKKTTHMQRDQQRRLWSSQRICVKKR